jgi:hypothetical protein
MSEQSVKRVCLWSGPRNVSTALMYSFAQRADTRVVDEPLYAHYLTQSGADHPGRDVVLASQDPRGARVIEQVVLGSCDRPVLFCKMMAHHLLGLERAFLARTENVLLVRDPREMLPSLQQQIPQAKLADTGLAVQSALFEELCARGRPPLVLDAESLLSEPERVLRELCARLGLAFDPHMLRWERGPRPEDGVWAPYWYHNVHRSKGFLPFEKKRQPFPAELEPLYAQCAPYYRALAAHALRGGAAPLPVRP